MRFEAFSYRTSARFGSVVDIEIESAGKEYGIKDDKTVTIRGPRINAAIYWTWIFLQVLLMFSFLPVTIIPLVLGLYWYLFLVAAVFFIHLGLGGIGAAVFWEAARLADFGKDLNVVSFKRSQVKKVKIGKGWARGIIWLAIPLFIPLVNLSAKDFCVSFEAPGASDEKNLVYALHMRTKEDALIFAGQLKG